MRALNCCRKRVNWYVREQHAIMKQHSVTGWFGQMHLTEGVNGKNTHLSHLRHAKLGTQAIYICFVCVKLTRDSLLNFGWHLPGCWNSALEKGAELGLRG